MRLREAVGGHQGLGPWVGQLLSAVVMLVCLVWLIGAFVVLRPVDHASLVAFVSASAVRVPATLAAIMLVWHAWLGAKSVVMDYLTMFGPTFRVFKYIGLIIYLALCLIWLIGVLWGAG